MILRSPLQQAAPPEPAADPEAPKLLEHQARDYLLAQPIGPGTVADLALPDEYVERAVDRMVREAFEERVGIVVADEAAEDTHGGELATTTETDGAMPGAEDPTSFLYPAGYATLALGVAVWFALRARKVTA